jgi:N,N'-diacetylchitobiose transport system permease protein
VLWGLAATLIALIWAFPVYWMINISLQPANQVISGTPSFYPKNFTWRAYQGAINDPNPAQFGVALKNSLLVTLLTLVVALVVGFVAALGLTRFRFRSRRTLIIGVLIIQMIPGEAMIVSTYRMIDGFHLLNTILGLGVLYVVAVVPFTIWTLRGFVAGVPVELEEAGQVDGLSKTGAFWRITFPLLAPGLLATGVFAFVQAWNDFLTALIIMTRPENVTIAVWLRFFQQATRATDWSGLMAGSVLMSIPLIVFFLIFQHRMVGGMVAGAVKG